MSKRTAAAAGLGAGTGTGGGAGSSAGGSSSQALTRASVPFDQLVSLQKRSWQLLCSLEELQTELVLGGEGIVMQWPQLLSRLSGLLSHLVFLSSSLTSPQTTFYSSQLNTLETALRREALSSNLFSPNTADQPNEAREAIRAKPYQLPASVDKLRFSDVAASSPSRSGGQKGGAPPTQAVGSDRTGNKLPFLTVHPFEPLPGMATAASINDSGNPSAGAAAGGGGQAANGTENVSAEDPTAVGQHLNYLYNLLRTRPDDTVSAEDTVSLRSALPFLLPDSHHPSDEVPSSVSQAQADKLRLLQRTHDRNALRSLRTWFHLASATDENGVRYDWKTRVGQEDLDALLAPDDAPAGGGAVEEEEPLMEEDLEEEEEEEGEDSDADMEDVG
ncbi:unnamed protein product [Tilletia controversa]|uniref:Uncharacterized protein n=2 Tax=Tilletia TaxID=13289 RepID=A0A177U1K4_9BASI|nr:hypothetical protein CF336_g5656 [Tilletia laevis]KAE8249233.1 hypothetical protein A4X03_0g6640 [Tilletia caries]CAD6906076.1 unnamed protein product [Tilletia controversa]KAE8206760.1 hypothetical protein CF335_g1632 [Tilletia laevis]CAD6890911.1 unnamed protein product [Tilletia caries]